MCDSNSHLQSPEVEQELVLWNLQEQVELLQIMHTFALLEEVPLKDVPVYAEVLKDCQFAQHQPQASLVVNKQCSLLLHNICHLSSTLLPVLCPLQDGRPETLNDKNVCEVSFYVISVAQAGAF